MHKLLVTGSAGLIGSEVVASFAGRGWTVLGVDNNMRADFFGPAGDTTWNTRRMLERFAGYECVDVDIRDRARLADVVAGFAPDAVVHTAAQPSHDLAASRPFDDFDVNAVGTLNLLEAVRRYRTDVPFVHLSTNKVYGDRPNTLELVETDTRWDFADPEYARGIAEDFPIDQSKHSVFGASKVAADVMVQEYGRYFGLPTCCLRGGCLTGPNHSGVQLHGFVSYLIRCNLEEREYTVFGYGGKQVRDNIHSHDVAAFIAAFIAAPRVAEVYNLGGGKANSISILEAFDLISDISGVPMKWRYDSANRIGDHICYYSDLDKMRAHYPGWDITKDLRTTFVEIHDSWRNREP